jgi:radical SAM superfamily enzyme YgiQ (UPF0313 family)
VRILLVNPTPGPDREYGALARASTELPQIGLAALASALQQAGHTVRVVDKNIDALSDEQICRLVGADDYPLVGLSVYVTTRVSALRLADRIHRAHPEATVIVGGPEATLAPRSFLHPAVDHVFVGEADRSVVAFADALCDGGLRRPIPGVLSRQRDRLVGDGTPQRIENLADLPPVELERFYDLDRYYPAAHLKGRRLINVMTMRGCPYRCTFCAAGEVSGRRLRMLDVDPMVELVRHYAERGFDSITFYDDTFTIDRKRTRAFCRRLIGDGLRVHWNCFTRVDCVDAQTLDLMRRAGCYLVTFGIESFNDKTLRRLRKGFRAAQAHEAIRQVRAAGMAAFASFMIGLPGETRADIEYTIRRVVASPLDLAVFPVFEPHKGTPIYQDCLREGRWVRIEDDGNRMLVDQEEIWVPNTVSREQVVELSRAAMRRFYLRPRIMAGMGRLMMGHPLSRWLRMAHSGLHYFLLRRLQFSRRTETVGSRYK